MPLLTALIFLPLAGAIFLAAMGRKIGPHGVRMTAFGVAFVDLLLALLAVMQFDSAAIQEGGYRFVESVAWIPALEVNYTVGMDGLSLLMVVLTAGLGLLSICASFSAIQHRETEFYAFLLLLQGGVVGTFLALDLFLFYIFWELMLIPLYFLIGIFGSGRKIYATMKFVLYTLVGSFLMLIAILVLRYRVGANAGEFTFSVVELTTMAPQYLDAGRQMMLFVMFFLAFAIKAPLFPFHTWLPDAHTEAPTAGSIMLAGVLLKTGVYGMMRFCIPFFPYAAQQLAPIICWLAVIAIIYGALTAMAQQDMKRLVAYSSVSHMGFIVLGLFAFTLEGIQGASLQMLNHGISTGGLFLAVGILYERTHTRKFSDYGGMYPYFRNFAFLTIIIVMSSAGLPGLNGFIGEFAILLGAWKARFVAGPAHIYAILAATGVILGAVYLLIMVQRVFYGPVRNEAVKNLIPLRAREAILMTSLVVMAIWIGLYPRPFLEKLREPSERVQQAANVEAIDPAYLLARAEDADVDAPAEAEHAEDSDEEH